MLEGATEEVPSSTTTAARGFFEVFDLSETAILFRLPKYFLGY